MPMSWVERGTRGLRTLLMALLLAGAGLPLVAVAAAGEVAAIEVPGDLTRIELGPRIDLLADPARQYAIDQLVAGEADSRFFRDPRMVPVFPDIGGAYWARITLHNPGPQALSTALVIAFPNFRQTIFYSPTADGYRAQRIDTGAHVRDVDLAYRNPAYAIELAAGERKTVYLRVDHHSARFPLALWSRAALDRFALGEYLIQGLLLGVLLCTLGYQLALTLLAREPEHWSLSLCIGTTVWVTFSMLGYQHLFFGVVGDWMTTTYLSAIMLMAWSIVLFGRHYLRLADKLPRFDLGLRGVEWACLALAVAALWSPKVANNGFPLVLLVGVSLIVVSALRLMWRRDPFAFLYMISLMPLVFVGTLATAVNHALLPLFDHYHSAVAAGFASGALLFAFSHAYRMGRRREAQRQLEFEKQRAESVARTQTAFLATMSHEIRTPLNAIMGMHELLARHSSSDIQRHYLRVAAESSEVLLSFINQILEFSRLESDVVVVSASDIDLPGLLNRCVDLLAARAPADTLTLDLDLAPGLPAAIHADADKLRQIVLNLLDNAVKFTPAGTVTLRASTRASAAGARLRIEVSDTGIGVAPAAREKIFERFQQADNSISRRFGGAGLGLAICRSLARAMGGDVDFQSVEGVGSTFWVEVPYAPATAPVVTASAADAIAVPGRPLHLLVADDNAINREITQALLEDDGHSVVCAADGAEALAALAAADFDCVLMDVSMPVMDGLEATRRIRRLDDPAKRDVRIVALTAHAFPEKMHACLDAGVNDVVTKPVRAAELSRALRGDAEAGELAPVAAKVDENTDHLVDRDQYAINVRLLGEAKAHEFFARQRVDTAAALQLLRRHLDAAAHEELAQLAHHLAGAFAFLGLPRLNVCARRLESAARAAEASLPAVLAEFEACVAQTDRVLDTLLPVATAPAPGKVPNA